MFLKRLILHPKLRFVWKLQLLVALGIYCYAALASVPAAVVDIEFNDKVMHFLGNFLLFCSLWLATARRFSPLYLLIGLVPFVIAIELGQYLVPSRMVDLRDILANLLGLVLGLCLCYGLEKLANIKSSTRETLHS